LFVLRLLAHVVAAMNSAAYRERAEQYAPKTAAEIQAAARELATQYSDHTVAAILKLDVNAVRLMIGPREAS
jgi:hypothetical protein